MKIDKTFLNRFVKVTEMAAYGASLHKGKGDKIAADQAAVDYMRGELNKIEMKGNVVIGEGELDEAPMLFINEKVGTQNGIEFDIAVDPLECTNFTAKNLPNSLSVMAISTKGNMLKAPDMYMEKIAIGPNHPKNLVDLDFTIEKNINLLADSKKKNIKDLTACLLKRPRHGSIIKSLTEMGVAIKFIDDGDVHGVISVGETDSHIDIFIGIGGAPEGVLAAAALSCLDCQMQTRLKFENEKQKIKGRELGIKNLDKKYNIDDMIKSDVIFTATGVTHGELVDGVKDLNDFFQTETYALHKSAKVKQKIINKIKK